MVTLYFLCKMFSIGVLFVLVLGYSNAFSENENQLLPPMYEMDDYRACRKENGLYCKITFKAAPSKSNNAVWLIIEKTKKNPYTFHRDIFYRYRCIPKNFAKDEDIKQLVTKLENNKLKNVSLTAQITDMRCRKFERISLTKNDRTFLYFLLSYLTIIIASTAFHILTQHSKGHHILKANEYLLCFSIKRNWEKFLQPTEYPDYVRLKSFQGLKAITMFVVIVGHTLMSLIPVSTSNPEFLEHIYTIPYFRYVINFGMNSVQVFFLISAWLFTNGMYPLWLNEKKLTPGPFLQGIGIRYFRLIGPLALFVLFSKTTLYKIFERGPQGGHIHINYEACNKNGWATLLLVNNYLTSDKQCFFISWYISADFQFFLATLALVYISMKYQLTEKVLLKILTAIFGFTWFYHALVIYINRFPVTVGTTPQKSKLEISLSSHETFALHTSLYSNLGGYCVGIVAGALYYRMKKEDFEISKWVLRCSLITPFMIFLSIFDYSPLVSAIIGASMKPMFDAGVACLVFGLAFSKDNSTLKTIFEWNKWEYLTKLSYCIYLTHFWITFGQEMIFIDLIEFSYIKLVLIYLIDAVLSVFLALVVFILIESPVRGLLSISVKKALKEMPKED